MKIEDILTNLKITCEQNDTSVNDVILLYLSQQLDLDLNQILYSDEYLLAEMQPPFEYAESEDYAYAVQRARDIYNILLGENEYDN